MKGSQEVVDFVSDRLREQRQKNQINLAQICEEVNVSVLVKRPVRPFATVDGIVSLPIIRLKVSIVINVLCSF